MARVGSKSLKVQWIEAPICEEVEIEALGSPARDHWRSADAMSGVQWRVHSTSLEYIRDAGRIFRRYDFHLESWLTKLVGKLAVEGSPEERQAVYKALTENRFGKAMSKALLIIGAPIGWGVLAIFGPTGPGAGAREYNRFVREVFTKDRFMKAQAARLTVC